MVTPFSTSTMVISGIR